MQLVQTVAPTQEPITLEEAKAFLRIIDNEDDALINILISTATEHVENVTNRQICEATYELYTDSFIYKLPKNPINSIVKIEYLDANGDYVLLDSNNYYLYEDNGIGKIEYVNLINSQIPSLQDHKKALKITFTCGYSEIPSIVKSYMNVKVSTLFENREEFVIGASIQSFGGELVENLLSSLRVRS